MTSEEERHIANLVSAALVERMGGLKIYDVRTDEFRVATQKDIDDLTAVRAAYGKLRRAFGMAQEELDGRIKGKADV